MNEVKRMPRLVIGNKVKSAIYTDMDEPICIVDSMRERNDDHEIARRLVVCWNALNGVPTELLEKSDGAISALATERREMREQRDELLNALRAQLDMQTADDVDAAYRLADTAIARATGETK